MSSHTGVNASDTATRYPKHSTWMTTLLIVAGAAATGFGARYLAFAPHTGAEPNRRSHRSWMTSGALPTLGTTTA